MFPPRQSDVLVVLSILGGIYFLFLIALKMDILMTIRAAKSTSLLGILPFIASFTVIYLLLKVIYLPQNFPHLKLETSRGSLSATMAFSNFPVVSEALVELNLIATELGQIALSSATFNDCIQFFVILSHHLVNIRELKLTIIGISCWIVFAFCSFYILRPMMKLIARSTPIGKPVNQMYVVFILLGALVMAGITEMIGVTYLIGPLVWGLIIPSGPPLGTTLVEKCELIISELLLPFFFLYVGLKTNLAALQDWGEFVTLQLILVAGDITKVVACVLVSMIYNIKPKHGTVLGLMLNIKGITHLIAFSKLYKLKVRNSLINEVIVIYVVSERYSKSQSNHG